MIKRTVKVSVSKHVLKHQRPILQSAAISARLTIEDVVKPCELVAHMNSIAADDGFGST
jgi:hypothetical protein